jgi:hypothetical protein
MRSWFRRLRSAWDWCAPGVSVLAVATLTLVIVTRECDRRETAVWEQGFRVGVEAAFGAEPVRWGICLDRGREFRCARTPDGALLEVRMP